VIAQHLDVAKRLQEMSNRREDLGDSHRNMIGKNVRAGGKVALSQ